jgi:hypothetical protein
MSEIDASLHIVLTFVFYTLLPSAAGGLASFLVALKLGSYRNNRYFAKSTIEVFGGAVTGCFLSVFFKDNPYVVSIAFLIGMAWSQLLQRIRVTITRMVEGALGEAGKR